MVILHCACTLHEQLPSCPVCMLMCWVTLCQNLRHQTSSKKEGRAVPVSGHYCWPVWELVLECMCTKHFQILRARAEEHVNVPFLILQGRTGLQLLAKASFQGRTKQGSSMRSPSVYFCLTALCGSAADQGPDAGSHEPETGTHARSQQLLGHLLEHQVCS